MRFVCRITMARIQTHIHNMLLLLLFHDNSGYANSPFMLPYTYIVCLFNCIILLQLIFFYTLSSFTCNHSLSSKYSRHFCVSNIWTTFSSFLPGSIFLFMHNSSYFLTLWRRIFFLISAHTVYKMWIIQEPNKLALWNKLHFEEKETESTEHV